ncbi:MAG: hypothetical protein HGA76_10660 [Candidatus Firestonebacteria bacterium]|nr:hypothetical protein [Candidatus Firestonebacteria bacterium]
MLPKQAWSRTFMKILGLFVLIPLVIIPFPLPIFKKKKKDPQTIERQK